MRFKTSKFIHLERKLPFSFLFCFIFRLSCDFSTFIYFIWHFLFYSVFTFLFVYIIISLCSFICIFAFVLFTLYQNQICCYNTLSQNHIVLKITTLYSYDAHIHEKIYIYTIIINVLYSIFHIYSITQ